MVHFLGATHIPRILCSLLPFASFLDLLDGGGECDLTFGKKDSHLLRYTSRASCTTT
jgi:hypothetical protein